MPARSKWIWLRFDVQKETQLEYIDARHFNTAQDILDRFHMKSCVLKLYDDSGRELNPKEHVLPFQIASIKER